MKKRIIIISALISFSFACAQVGVNTAFPKATFDITAKNPTGIVSAAEGLLVPRVDRQKAQSMTGVVTSTLIYVNNIASGAQTGTAINIDAVGYYYFDGTVWAKINPGNSGKNTNIYTVNGNLTSNRTVSQTGRTLVFTGTAANAFSVDDATFSINTTTHALGIGTNTPTNKMVVKGVNAQPSSTSATLRIDGSSNHALDIGTFNDSPYGSYITSLDKSGTGLPLVLNPFGSSVGIGIINPSSSAVLDLFATDKGFLPPRLTTEQRDALNPKTAGLMIYNSTIHCMEHWDTQKWVSKCSTSSLVLNCAGANHSGILTSRVSASGVSTTIPYTDGNGSAYASQSVNSTGVTGLTATLPAGNFANGSGTLTYTITGTPSSSGTASFTIIIGGQTCTFTRNIILNPNPPIINDNGYSCNGSLIGNGFGTKNLTLNGSTFSATVTNVSGADTSFNATRYFCSVIPANKHDFWSYTAYQLYWYNGTTIQPRTIRIKFNKNVSNLKMIVGELNFSGYLQVTVKRNGVVINPTFTGLDCNAIVYNSSTKRITGSLFGTTVGGYTIGGQWFDEIEITGSKTITSDLSAGALLEFCLGAVQN